MDRSIDTPKVMDIMTSEVVVLSEDFNLIETIYCFSKFGVTSSPVVDREMNVIGFVSESDCIGHVANLLFYDDMIQMPIQTFMVKNVHTAREYWDLFELENFFKAVGIRKAPVIDEEEKLVGIVTRKDVLKALMKLLAGREDYKEAIKEPLVMDRQQIRIMAENQP